MITFIGLRRRTAGKIRGQQIADQIEGANFFDHSEVYNNVSNLNKHVIVVRNNFDQKFLNFLKKRGFKIGYDVLDVISGICYFQNIDNPNYQSYVKDDLYDYYITNNNFLYDKFCKNSKKPVFVIPHHHINEKRERSYDGSSNIINVGYLGLQEQLVNEEKIKQICNELGLNFLTNPGNDKKNSIEFLKNIQVGITHMVGFKHLQIFNKCKPNTKLTNYQSFGIIPVCNKTLSFDQFGGGLNFNYNDLQHFKEIISNLMNDKVARQNISNSCYKHAENFHISNIVTHYEKILKEVN